MKIQIWNLKEKRYLTCDEIFKYSFFAIEGQNIDELGASTHGAIVVYPRAGYKIIRSE